jgi:N-sulfoglucosamine sulfohydrolase
MARRRTVFWLTSLLGLFTWPAGATAQAKPADARPNILWITCEDISPNLGCYGDAYAVTPNLDRLGAESVRFTRAFAQIGVCAPSRSSLITGVYACSLGTHHMRCQGKLPGFVHCFPQYLREAGYYCTNNSKTDYNFAFDKATWDESSAKAHWRKRPAGKPFFSVFNFVTSHESQIRLAEPAYQKRTAAFSPRERHDPAKAPLPPYHPDTPEVRRDWAR